MLQVKGHPGKGNWFWNGILIHSAREGRCRGCILMTKLDPWSHRIPPSTIFFSSQSFQRLFSICLLPCLLIVMVLHAEFCGYSPPIHYSDNSALLLVIAQIQQWAFQRLVAESATKSEDWWHYPACPQYHGTPTPASTAAVISAGSLLTRVLEVCECNCSPRNPIC